MLRTKFGSRRAVLAASSEQVQQKSTRVQRPELHIRNQGSAMLRERCWCSWHKCSPYQCPRRHLPCSHAAEEDNGVQEASLCRTLSISKQSCPFSLPAAENQQPPAHVLSLRAGCSSSPPSSTADTSVPCLEAHFCSLLAKHPATCRSKSLTQRKKAGY